MVLFVVVLVIVLMLVLVLALTLGRALVLVRLLVLVLATLVSWVRKAHLQLGSRLLQIKIRVAINELCQHT